MGMLKIERRSGDGIGADPTVDPPAGLDAPVPGVPTSPPPRLPGRRNPKWIALGVIAICLGALLSYLIYARVAAESSVLIMTRTVYRGSVIAAGDLAPVTVSGALPGDVVAADRADELVGRTALYDLVAGSVVPATAIGRSAVPPEGRAAVGIRLIEGRLPSGLLHPGSVVRLIALPAEGVEAGATDQYTGGVYPAKIIDAVDGADGMSMLVNVEVAADQAAAVALLSAQERLAVVRDHDGGR